MLHRLLIALRLRRRPDPLAQLWVRVHLTAGAPSVEGRYLRREAGYLFVDTPTILPDAGEDKKLGGQLAIPEPRVLFVQPMPS